MSATLGIDLSSRPERTAVCFVEWFSKRAEVSALWRGTDSHGLPLRDDLLVRAMHGAGELPAPSKVALDAPLGWPVDFVRGVTEPGKWPVKIDESRARLERRALICALTARAAAKGKTLAPPSERAEEASLEGWIHLPKPGALSSLL